MKKLVMMLVCMFAVHTMVMADNDKPIEVRQLQWLNWSRECFIKAMMWCSRMGRR